MVTPALVRNPNPGMPIRTNLPAPCDHRAGRECRKYVLMDCMAAEERRLIRINHPKCQRKIFIFFHIHRMKWLVKVRNTADIGVAMRQARGHLRFQNSTTNPRKPPPQESKYR